MSSKETDKTIIGADLLFCLFLFVLVVVFFIMALGYKSVTRNAPMVVMIPLGLLLILQITLSIKKLKEEWKNQNSLHHTPTCIKP